MATNNSEMPFLDHLEELRWRLLKSLAALVVCVGLAFWILQKYDIILWLQQPIQPYLRGRALVFTHPGDPFWILITSSVVLGSVLALPVVIFQLWSFLSPALYGHEKKVVIPVLFAGLALFIAGVALSYFLILPLTLKVFFSIQATGLEPMITFKDYFDFAISMSLALGAVFELPIAIVALTALGILTPAILNKYRRHAVTACLIASAFITPGQDPFSLIAIAIPLYFLYELSFVASLYVYRRRQRRAAKSEEPAEAIA